MRRSGAWVNPADVEPWTPLEPETGYTEDVTSPPFVKLVHGELVLTGVVLGSFPANSTGIYPYKPLAARFWPNRNIRIGMCGASGASTCLAIVYTDGRIEVRTSAATGYMAFMEPAAQLG